MSKPGPKAVVDCTKKICGIYKVYLNEDLFYVGASRHIYRRFRDHINTDKPVINRKYQKDLKYWKETGIPATEK